MDSEEQSSSPLGAEAYAELHKLAHHYLKGQPRDALLQTTALVNDACLKMMARTDLGALDRKHLLALTATAMRHLLVDRARQRRALKHAPPGERVPLDNLLVAYEDRALDLVVLDECLRELETFAPELTRAVELHFFAGLTLEETAGCLELSKRTLERRWRFACAWLRTRMA